MWFLGKGSSMSHVDNFSHTPPPPVHVDIFYENIDIIGLQMQRGQREWWIGWKFGFTSERELKEGLKSQQKVVKIFLLSISESVKFSLIESVICLFADSSARKLFFTHKSVNFHSLIIEKYFFNVKSVNFHWSNRWNLTDLQ